MEYSAGTVSTLFWLLETRKTANLMVEGISKDEIKRLAYEENLYQVNADARKRRIFGVVVKRLGAMPDCLVNQIATADIATVKLLVLISILKTDLLFFDFLHEVHRHAIILGENLITNRAIHSFFDEKKAQSEIVSRWSDSSIKNLKQCYTKMLFEAGVLSDASTERKIIIPSVDYKLRKVLEDNNLKAYLNAITGEA
ncbi:DUF1819 family protein [Paenibacillus sp. CMAA1364]